MSPTKPLNAKTRKKLKEAADAFLEAVRDSVDGFVFLGDVDGLGGLVSVVKMYSDHRVIEALRDKGMQSEIDALCEKAGMKPLSVTGGGGGKRE